MTTGDEVRFRTVTRTQLCKFKKTAQRKLLRELYHDNAARLAAGLREVSEISVTAQATNMVFLNLPEAHAKPLENHLATRGMLMQGVYAARLVTHLDVSRDDVDAFVAAVKDYFKGAGK